MRFASAFTILFLLLTLPRLWLHELWRDEAWLWLVVGQSRSLGELFHNLSRSGQGYLFPLLCYAAKAISSSWRTMQFLHLLLASGGAFVFLRWAPLPRRERALFVLGYLPFYEYAVLSRHYALGALLLWLACAAWRGGAALAEPRRLLAVAAALGLLCQTTVYGFLLAAAFAAAVAVTLLRPRDSRLPQPAGAATLSAAFAVAALGAVAGLVQLIPEAGTSFAPGWRLGWHADLAERVLQMPWRALVPLPRLGLHFWNSNALDAWPALMALLGAALLAGMVAFVRDRAARAALVVGALGFLAFGYTKFIGVARHDGHWWLLLAAAVWLAGGHAATAPRLRPLWLALLAAHVAVGAYASAMDLAQPFSNAARTAERLRDLGLADQPLFGYREPPAASIALYLDRPLWAPSRGLFVRFPDWGPEQHDLPPADLRCAARNFTARQGRDAILVINQELPAWPELEPLAEVTGAIQASEDYHLYRLRFNRLRPTAADAGCATGPSGT